MKNFLKRLSYFNLEKYDNLFFQLITEKENFIHNGHGKSNFFESIINGLPKVFPSHIELNSDIIKIGRDSEIDNVQKNSLFSSLYKMRPWRKGPFNFFGLDLEAEWASDLKWNRLKKSIASLKNRRILDIGSSSGYYMFRMLFYNPRLILGIEPYLHFYYQFLIISNYIKTDNMFCLPVKFEEFPETEKYFDTIFCMGILYHTKSPIQMLSKINMLLKKGGEIVLETLIIEQKESLCLFPEKRYAKMNNVYFLPTVSCLENFLKRCGFENIRCVDISKTTEKEQKKTKWVNTESLEDFLSCNDKNKTIEGYPAPVRAVIIANAKD
jgi:tRNA (mo5U34)-methyltransferase